MLNRTLQKGLGCVLCVVSAGASAAAPTTHATLEAGVGYVNRDSYKFGDYTGLNKKGAYFIGNAEVSRKDAHDTGAGHYWDLKGTDLGLTSRNVQGEAGIQGSGKMWFEYDELPKFQTDTARTIFNGAGTTNLTLPSTWVADQTTAGMTALNSSLQDLNVKHDRRNYHVGFSKLFASRWELKTKYQREIKEGTRIAGAVIGASGGFPRTVLIPEPIDYVTDQWDVGLGFTGEKGQFHVGYYASLFNDRNDSLTWQNPYARLMNVAAGNEWPDGVGYPGGKGRLGLPPDNQFHQLNFTGGYSLTGHTRVTAHGSLGRMTQDETFLPYSVNPVTITTPMPRSSLDGKINTALVNLGLTSNPLPKLHVDAHYRFDNRSNKTPMAQYLYVGGDAALSTGDGGSPTQPAIATTNARTNLSPSLRQHQVKLEAGYDIFKRTVLQGGYVYDQINRTFSEVKQTREHTYNLKLKHTLSEYFTGGAHFAHIRRHASTYQDTLPYRESYSSQYITSITPVNRYDNHPLVRRFYIAEKRRNQWGLFAGITPCDKVQFNLAADVNDDNYPQSVMGLKKRKGQAYSGDITLTPTDKITAYTFYTHEHTRSDQNGRAYTGTAGSEATSKLVTAWDPTRNWSAKLRDTINTAGLGLKFTPSQKWEAGAEYVYSRSRGNISIWKGTGIIPPPALPLPTLTTQSNGIKANLTYKAKDNLSVKFHYGFERLRSRDWALDDVPIALLTTQNVITVLQKSHRYAISTFGLSLRYEM